MKLYCVPFLLALPGIAAQDETKIPGANIAAIASDRNGNVYVTGSTTSPDLPATAGSLQTSLRGGVCGRTSSGAPAPCSDAFVAKINPDRSLAYVTYLGGGGNDAGTAIAAGPDGGVWVAGTTASAGGDAFIVKIAPAGDRLEDATFLGGNAAESPRQIVFDAQGNVCVAGSTASFDFPITPGDVSSSRPSSFVTMLGKTLREFVSSTALDADLAGVAVAPDGSAYVTG